MVRPSSLEHLIVANDNKLIPKEFVVIYFVNSQTDQVYLLKKSCKAKKGVEHLHNKLVGIGGEVENIDRRGNSKNPGIYLFNAARREVKEEIEYELEDDKTLIYCGRMIDHFGASIHHFKFFTTDELPIGKKKEGITSFYPITHLKTTPTSFPYGYVSHLKKMLIQDESFETFDMRKPQFADFLNNS
jgi:hypothetical protein